MGTSLELAFGHCFSSLSDFCIFLYVLVLFVFLLRLTLLAHGGRRIALVGIVWIFFSSCVMCNLLLMLYYLISHALFKKIIHIQPQQQWKIWSSTTQQHSNTTTMIVLRLNCYNATWNIGQISFYLLKVEIYHDVASTKLGKHRNLRVRLRVFLKQLKMLFDSQKCLW